MSIQTENRIVELEVKVEYLMKQVELVMIAIEKFTNENKRAKK